MSLNIPIISRKICEKSENEMLAVAEDFILNRCSYDFENTVLASIRQRGKLLKALEVLINADILE